MEQFERTLPEDFQAYRTYLEKVCHLSQPLKVLALGDIYTKEYGIPILETAEIRLRKNDVISLIGKTDETYLDATGIARRYQTADADLINRILIIRGLQTARDRNTGNSVSLENIMSASMYLFVPTILGQKHGGKLVPNKAGKYSKCVWKKSDILKYLDTLLIRKD